MVKIEPLRELSQLPIDEDEYESKIDEILEELYIKKNKNNVLLYVLISSIATAGTGINMYQWIPYTSVDFSKDRSDANKEFMWKIPDYYRIEETTKEYNGTKYIKADISAIYSEDKSYVKTSFKVNRQADEEFTMLYKALYHQNKQLNEIDNTNESLMQEYINTINNILTRSNCVDENKFNRISNLTAEMKFFSQIQGRPERTCIATKHKLVWFENSNIQIDGETGFSYIFNHINEPHLSYCDHIENIALTGTMAKIKEVFNQKDRFKQIKTSKLKPKTQMLKSLWKTEKTKKDKKNIELYDWIKSGVLLKNITLSDANLQLLSEEYDNNDFDFSLSDFYVPNNGGVYKYQFNELSAQNSVMASFDKNADFKHMFSKKELKIDIMNTKFFNEDKVINGIHFDNADDWIVSPEFADIIKGDCGEHGYRILGQKYGFETKHLEGQEKEFFDYSTSEEYRFVDIKYQNVEKLENFLDKNHIISKLEHIKPKGTNASVLIINMYPHGTKDDFEDNPEVLGSGDEIQIINQVLDEDGNVNPDAIKAILDFVNSKKK